MWVTIQGCGSTLVCRDCLADLGDDRSKAAFYRLPSDPRGKKIWIVLWGHRHGVDAWPIVAAREPDTDEIADRLEDFEHESEEYIEVRGPFPLSGRWPS